MVDQLVLFLAQGLVSQPQEVKVNLVEGESVVVVEIKVHEQDLPLLNGPQDRNIKAIRQILSASSGKKKTVLEIINPHDQPQEESAEE